MDSEEPFAATRIISGTDVDYGALTHLLVKQLVAQPSFSVHYYRKRVTDISRDGGGQWRVEIEDAETAERQGVKPSSFLSARAAVRFRCCRSPASRRPMGMAVSPSAASGCAATSTPSASATMPRSMAKPLTVRRPMSVPHLDTRVIGGKNSLLFGPYAGFSTRFLKHGSLTDLFRSIRPGNIVPMLAVAKDNWQLAEYLIGQVLQTSAHQFAMLQQFFPRREKA